MPRPTAVASRPQTSQAFGEGERSERRQWRWSAILTADQVRDLVERMLKSSGRRVHLSSPIVDAMLTDGSRLHVVIPDIFCSVALTCSDVP